MMLLHEFRLIFLSPLFFFDFFVLIVFAYFMTQFQILRVCLLKSYALPSEISMVLLVTLSKTSYHAKQ
jgi:hypothetical protein